MDGQESKDSFYLLITHLFYFATGEKGATARTRLGADDTPPPGRAKESVVPGGAGQRD